MGDQEAGVVLRPRVAADHHREDVEAQQAEDGGEPGGQVDVPLRGRRAVPHLVERGVPAHGAERHHRHHGEAERGEERQHASAEALVCHGSSCSSRVKLHSRSRFLEGVNDAKHAVLANPIGVGVDATSSASLESTPTSARPGREARRGVRHGNPATRARVRPGDRRRQGPEHGRAGPELRDRRDRRLRLAPPRPARAARGAWWVVDQGSANGTYVNSLKVAEKELKNDQEIRFGALAFRVGSARGPGGDGRDAVSRADDSATVDGAVGASAAARPRRRPAADADPAAGRPAAPAARRRPPRPRRRRVPPPAKERFRPTGPAAPVPQMPGGAPPAEKGKSPLFWVAIGCCGCLLLVALLAGVIGGGVFMATKGAADAAHAWLGQVRQGQTERGRSRDDRGLSQTRPTAEEVEAITTAIARLEGRDLPEPLRRQRPRDADRRPDRRPGAAADRDQAREGRRDLEGRRRHARRRVEPPRAGRDPSRARRPARGGQLGRRAPVRLPARLPAVWCPCATCQGHAPDAKYLDLEGQELVHVDGVGNYAVSLHLAGRPQHRHLQLPAAARALPLRGLRGREALGRR